MTTRWQPMRGGLIGVWRYAEETFTFHRGRLLLRGPNGAGKSMALELLFPFLLDASASPFRLSSAAKSRGGLYERVMAGSEEANRVGFVWAEFRRGEEVFTVGVRLRTSSNTRRVTSDWFTTTHVVGDTLHLLDEHRAPLSRAALEEAIGESGRLHGSAEEYRAAVRAAIFPGFSAEQYDAMITTLLALRREKISQDLTPDRLSEVLSASLPPLDEHDLTEIAEGFERLDRRKAEIDQLEADLAHVGALARRQRSYARVVFGVAAAAVRTAETRRDEVTRAEREAREQLDVVEGEGETLGSEEDRASTRIEELEAHIDTLKHHDAYRAGGQIDALRAELGRAVERLGRDRSALAARQAEAEEAASALDGRQAALGEATTNLDGARADADRLTDRVGAGGLMEEAAAMGGPDDAEGLVGAWAEARRDRLADVRAALDRLDDCIAERKRWDEQVEADREAVASRQEHRRTAGADLDATLAGYATAVTSWVTECRVLDQAALRRALPSLLDDPDALGAAVSSVAAAAREAHAVAGRDLDVRKTAIAEARHALEAERVELVGGRTLEPDAPAWRSERGGRPGAPLWRLVDFAAGVSDAERDGVEAALVGSGLLDAWLYPDGRVVMPEAAADVILDAASGRPLDGATLADVVVPLDRTPVPATAVRAVLAQVALVGDALVPAGETPVAVAGDGSFRMGPLTGKVPVEPSRFVGATAQERHRARRLAGIDAALEALSADSEAVMREEADLQRRREALDAELAAAPSPEGVRAAVTGVERADAALAEAGAALGRSEARRAETERAVRLAQRDLAGAGALHGVPTDRGALDEYAAAVSSLTAAATAWANRWRDRLRAEAELGRARQDQDSAHQRADEAARVVVEIEAQHRDVRTRLATLTDTVGAAFEEIVAQIDDAERERGALGKRRREITERRHELAEQVGQYRAAVSQAQSRREEADEERARAHAEFVEAVGDGMAADAEAQVDPDVLSGITAVLEASRAAGQTLDGTRVDESALSKAQNDLVEAVHTARQALGSRVEVFHEQAFRGWWLVRASAGGGLRRRIVEVTEHLARDLAAAQDELREEEERLFEETLAGGVRRAVAGRIRGANELVDRINRELASVRTAAADLQVRLRWEVDPEQPEAVRSARQLLLRDTPGEAERAALHDFFRARLEQARADLDGTGDWETRLRQVLDYRAWHRFVLEATHRDWEGFREATSRRLGRLSTGERSIALHLPMLAAVAAHYAGGDGAAGCPRLILLDELFAGVDAANRAQLFGMFVTWDLDAIFTSDHEWCNYPSLDGIAIHFLHPSADNGEPVTSSRWVWDGRRRVSAPLPSAV